MRHRYVFRDINETLLTVLETDRPITHLAIGANLVLHTDDYASKADRWLRVESIMLGRRVARRSIHSPKWSFAACHRPPLS